MKLWPLDPETGAHSSSLKTGFAPPPIAELASRTSASMDIEILVGRDGLTAVAKAETAAKAKEAAAKAKEAAEKSEEAAAKAAAAAPEAVQGAPAVVASPEEGGEIAGTTAKSAEEGAWQHPSVPAIETVPSDLEAGGTVDATTTTSSAAPHDGAVAPAEANAGTATTSEEATAGEAAAAPLPRKLALEVEVFAIGSINVPYLMALVKVSFEQVRVRACVRASRYRSSNVAGRRLVGLFSAWDTKNENEMKNMVDNQTSYIAPSLFLPLRGQGGMS